MVFQSLIERKRDGAPLESGAWHALIAEYMGGRIPEYQMSALLMAVVWRGLSDAELHELTEAMIASGDRLQFDGFATPRVDKHSTGGVGDKVSLVLAPLVASCGVAVPMMSGPGLGHTGGTVDKLESIPGFRTSLSLQEAEAQVRSLGCAMFRQTDEIAPADRRLYALRDVTATVESIPLIAASIMSKKLAEGLGGLVLDVKTGSGAFLPDPAQALLLAQTLVRLGEAYGCPTVALLTAMDRPLGRACGNALEVEEALLALQGEGPEDLMQVTFALGVEMLLLAGVARGTVEARRRLDEAISSGRALETFGKIVEAQGGNPAIVNDPSALPQAGAVEIFEAETRGFVTRVEPRAIGRAVVEMGGGRRALGDEIDPSVGFVITVKPGAHVAAGEPIASIFARDAAGIAVGIAALKEAISIGEKEPLSSLVSHRVTAEGIEMLAPAPGARVKSRR
jgi:pyrimidine-nucleoside phosphorylase